MANIIENSIYREKSKSLTLVTVSIVRQDEVCISYVSSDYVDWISVTEFLDTFELYSGSIKDDPEYQDYLDSKESAKDFHHKVAKGEGFSF